MRPRIDGGFTTAERSIFLDGDAGRALHLRRHTGGVGDAPIVRSAPVEDETFSGVRCPLCAWRPLTSSRWCCDAHDSPEPFFPGCGTVWNTFSTHGVCPGCTHQWHWTSCLRCSGWSPHDEWYEEQDRS